MKKNLILFLIFFCTNIITTPTKCAPSLPGDRVDFINLVNFNDFERNSSGGTLGYHQKDTCQRGTPDTALGENAQWLYTPTIGDYFKAYKAAEDSCPDGTRIYTKKSSGISSDTQHTTPQCWEASVKPINNHVTRQWKQCQNVQNCETVIPNKWYPNRDGDKVPVFVHNTGKVITYNNNFLPQSLIIKYKDTSIKVSCIGYACVTNGNIYTYGCQDGSCTPGCPNDDSNGGGDDGDGGGSDEPEHVFPDPPAPPKDPVQDFDNVVKPYLDLLGD